jgi:D-alanine-D-alanine ligase-like ATP-grasp enzyme
MGASSITGNSYKLRSKESSTYHQPALVETFIDGRELTCGVIGNNGDLRVLPILEVDFQGYPSNLAPVLIGPQK